MLFAQRCFSCEGPISYCFRTFKCEGGCNKNICRRELEHSVASFPRGLHNACYDCNNQINIREKKATEELLRQQNQEHYNFVMDVQDEIIAEQAEEYLNNLTQATQEVLEEEEKQMQLDIEELNKAIEEKAMEISRLELEAEKKKQEDEIIQRAQQLRSQEDTHHQVLGRPEFMEPIRHYSVQIQVGRRPAKKAPKADRELVKIAARSIRPSRAMTMADMRFVSDMQAIGRQEKQVAEKRLRTCRIQNGVRVQFRPATVYTS